MFVFEKRAKHFNLNDLRRIMHIIATNRISTEEEVTKFSHLMDQANITSNRYDKQYMRAVN